MIWSAKSLCCKSCLSYSLRSFFCVTTLLRVDDEVVAKKPAGRSFNSNIIISVSTLFKSADCLRLRTPTNAAPRSSEGQLVVFCRFQPRPQLTQKHGARMFLVFWTCLLLKVILTKNYWKFVFLTLTSITVQLADFHILLFSAFLFKLSKLTNYIELRPSWSLWLSFDGRALNTIFKSTFSLSLFAVKKGVVFIMDI